MDNDSHSDYAMGTSNTTASYQSLVHTFDIVYGVISSILIPIICIGNFLVLFSMWKFPKLRTKTNILVANLSVADFIMGAVTLPLYTAFFFNREKLEQVKYMCVSKYALVVFSSSASLLSLVAIAFDRYAAILHPLRYHIIVTHRRIMYFLIGQWLYDVVTKAIPFFWNTYDQYHSCSFYILFPRIYSILLSFVSIAICLTISLYLYIKIFIVARKHRKCFNSQLSECKSHQIRRDAKSAKIMALILFLFFIFWIPFLFVGPLRYLGIAEHLLEIIKNVTILIAMSNSMVNPIVYCWLRKEFTWAFKQLCCRRCETVKKRKGQLSIELSSSSKHSMSESQGNTSSSIV